MKKLSAIEEMSNDTLAGEPADKTQTSGAADLPPEFYEHLYQARLAQSRLNVELLTTKSGAPLVGSLIDRMRVTVHQLVIFYVDRLAAKQAEVNNQILQALAVLGKETSGNYPDVYRHAGRPDHSASPASDWATLEDVYACYRLLFGREADEAGLRHWTSVLKHRYVTRGYLVDSFLNEAEFKSLRAERSEPVPVQMKGFKMYVRRNDNFIGAVIEREKQYEPHVTKALHRLLSPGSTFIDVGANIGFFSLLAASRVGSGGRVIAFEPNPSNCELIHRSITANGFEKIITLHSAAVAEKKGQLYFTAPGIDSNGRVINPAEAAGGAITLSSVEAVALDDVLADTNRVDVIKIDVEGAEARVWQGMRQTIQRHRPILAFEFSPILLRQTSEVDPGKFLEEIQSDYDLFIISPTGDTAAKPDSIPAILQAHADSGLSHLNILARPRS